jgi:Tol biopolymer transport system component
MYPGNIDFSPDNTQLTVSQHQMFGYMQSPLYVANINYAGMTEVFSIPDVAPVNAQWSPDGAWLAFTGVIFDEDAFTEIDRCVRLVKPDGSQEYVAECMFAEFVTWSPDGGHLLYSQRVGAKNQLYIYNLGTSARTKLPIQADPYTLVDWGRLP